jgi:hypothetical protein
MMKLLVGVAAALALLAASPARAGEGEGCKNCPHHAKEAAAETKGTQVAEAEKKDEKACHCGAKEAKDCKCGAKCHCTEADKDAKKDKKG